MNRLTKQIRYLIKNIRIILFLTLICAFGCVHLFFQSFSSGLCGNEIFQEVYSPDNEYKVVVFQRNCGATTGFSTQISILKASEELPNKNGNIFRMDDHPDYTNVQVVWDSNQAISIDYSPGYEVFFNKENFRDSLTTFKINYKN